MSVTITFRYDLNSIITHAALIETTNNTLLIKVIYRGSHSKTYVKEMHSFTVLMHLSHSKKQVAIVAAMLG